MKDNNIKRSGSLLQNQVFGYLLVFVVIVLMGAVGYLLYAVPHTAFINSNRVYNEFSGKKELQAKLNDLNSKQSKILDTLKLEIETMQVKLKMEKKTMTTPELEVKIKNYRRLTEEFEQNIDQQKEKFIEEAWNQINKYMEDYGKDHHYDYIYGANGTGSLMYANKTKDITDDVIKYVNKKYEGH